MTASPVGAPIPTAPAPVVPEPATVPVEAIITGEWAREAMLTISHTTPRSLQSAVGPSEIGQRCRRRLAYRLTHAPAANLTDPAKALVGIGVHAVLGEGLGRLDPARYLVEHPVTYRGTRGSCDVFDLYRRRLVDWKTSTTKRIARYRTDGPPPGYVVQLNIYAAGLAAQGHRVDTAALVFIPRDGALSDVYAWTTQPDPAVADQAIDAYEALAAQMAGGATPGDVEPWPSTLCTYCPNHQPQAVDLSVGCPGKDPA